MRIEKIEIKKYFFLEGITIEPGDFCVIYGTNESGKTMLLDAILDALFHIRSRRREFGGLFPNLFNRYDSREKQDVAIFLSENGNQRLYPSSRPLSETLGIKGLHLRNMLVVREGDIEFVQHKSRYWDEWKDLLRQHLSGVEGGLHRIKEKVADIAGITPKDGKWVNREGRRLKDEYERMRNELSFIEKSTEEIFELERLRYEHRKLLQEEEKTAAEVDLMHKLEKKEIYLRSMREMEELNRLKRDEKVFGPLDKKDFELWHDIETRIVSLTNELNSLMKEYQTQEEELKRKEDMAASMRMKAAEWERREIEVVPEVEKRLQNLRSLYARRHSLYRWQPLTVALFFASCGLAVLFLILYLMRSTANITGTAVASALAVLFYLFWLHIRKIRWKADSAKREVFSFFEQIGEAVRDIEEAERWLETGRSSARESRAKAELLFMEVAREQAQFEQLSETISKKRALLEEVRGELDELKRKTGVATLKELQAQFEQLAQIRSRIDAYRRVLSERLATSNEKEFYKKIVQLRGYAEVEGDYDEQRHKKLEEKLTEIRSRRDKIVERMSELQKKFAVYGVSASEDIWLRKEKLRRSIGRLEMDRTAAHLAMRIVDELLEGQDGLINSIMDGGAESTGAIFSRLTEGTYNAAFWKGDEMYVETASGGSLHAAKLSSGTKVQLYFAMRIALIHRILEKKKTFLLLDDPFLPCDTKRLLILLDTLLRLTRSGWQVLYFTVDKEIADWALEHYEDGVRLYHLRSPLH